jgi:hypothetical protein
MNYPEFVRSAVQLFQCRKKAKRISERVFRGRAAKCDSDIEDLIAKAISGFLPQKYTLLVDQPISFSVREGSRKKTNYPDICVIQDNHLMGIVEVKIDLGYLKQDWVRENNIRLEELRGAASLSYNKDVGTPERCPQSLKPAQQVLSSVVVLTGKNAHGRMELFGKQDDCFILIPDHHPNSHKIGEKDLERFIAQISETPLAWKKMEHYFKSRYT